MIDTSCDSGFSVIVNIEMGTKQSSDIDIFWVSIILL
jgi:hypothetical protein